MSRERAARRAEREAVAAQRLRQHEHRRSAEAARRLRRHRWRRLLGRDVRRAKPGTSRLSARRKERRATIASALLVVVVLTYLMTRSIAMVVGVLLVASIATPALAAAFLDRSKK